ncbi:hypothetical protein P3T37_006440 [Kitasatospora sp. MAA4]|uniref:DUF6542 domain-containing protein n=1 Tax=Kitasatospora sp. MAA4 TaxID=3035093 RepID=UPI00247673B2|nr:DUF6542 domain-containing protein [Kitasatospora sp. MAA4]MDH6137009.1 hypothetical protein [Kitasatospora sp. MAA4]
MAGQWAGAPAEEAEGHAEVPGQRRAPAERPTTRRADLRRAPQSPAGARRDGRRACRAHNRRPARGTGGTAALLVLVLPLVGALLDQLFGSGPGWTFGVLTVLGTAAAAWLSSRAGWWWVVTAPPPVVLVVTAATQLLADSSKYQDGKALATDAARWAIHGFPVMASAVAAAVAVVSVRVVRESGGRRA